MNYTVSLENFLDEDADFVIGEDWNGLNAGVFFLRVCQDSIDFIDRCIQYQPTNFDKTQTPWWWWPSDQCAFTRCLDTIKSKVVHHSLFNGYVIGPSNHLNNDWRYMNIGSFDFVPRLFKRGDFILHLVSQSHDKVQTIKQLLKKVVV
jgi:hypothetical protein